MNNQISVKHTFNEEQVQLVFDVITDSISNIIPKLMENILKMIDDKISCPSGDKLLERERRIHEDAVQIVKTEVMENLGIKLDVDRTKRTLPKQQCKLELLHQPWELSRGKLSTSIAEITDKCNCVNIEGEIKKFRNHLNAYKRYLHQYDKLDVGGNELFRIFEADKYDKPAVGSNELFSRYETDRQHQVKTRSAEAIINDAYMNCKHLRDDQNIDADRVHENKDYQKPLNEEGAEDHEDGSDRTDDCIVGDGESSHILIECNNRGAVQTTEENSEKKVRSEMQRIWLRKTSTMMSI